MLSEFKRRAIPKQVKLEVLKRSGGMCEAGCGNVGKEMEHRIPVALGGENTVENLWLACPACHKQKTKTEDRPRINKAKRQGREIGQQARRKAGKTAKIAGRGFDTRLKRKLPTKKHPHGQTVAREPKA